MTALTGIIPKTLDSADFWGMKELATYIVPYTISQVLGWAILIVAWRNTRLARVLFFLVFAWAGITNLSIALRRPEAYLEYAKMSVPFYRQFILGWFRFHLSTVVPAIAVCQLLIAVGMTLTRRWVQLACAGSIIFLVSIAPLGVGAAFPCTLVLAAAAGKIWKDDPKQLLWRRPERAARSVHQIRETTTISLGAASKKH